MPYLNVDEVQSALTGLSMAYPGQCELIALPNDSIEGRTINAVRLADGPLDNRPAMMFIGCQHAREWGSADICVNFAADLLEAYSSGAGLSYGGTSFTAGQVQQIMEDTQVFVLPCVNPDGRHFSQNDDSMWRKNRNPAEFDGDPDTVGVDLNRNYDFLWDFPNLFAAAAQDDLVVSTDPGNDTYHGSAPHSEPEVQNVVWLLDSYPQIRWLVDIHSYSQLLYYQWGNDENQITEPSQNFLNPAHDSDRGLEADAYGEYIRPGDQSASACLAERMRSSLQGVRGINYTTGQSFQLYPTSGTATDYPYSRHWVDATKTRTLGFLIEWGITFQPAFSEMENIILDVSAALVDFAIAAPCECSIIEIELTTPAINFNAVPEDETAYRAAAFSATSCRDVHLEIVSGPTVLSGPLGTAFGTPAGTTDTVPGAPSGATDAYIWLSYTGTDDGDTATGTVTIRCVETTEEWEIPITADTVERPTVALALVLDKSGSMDWASGFPAPLETRIKVLRLAANHLVNVLFEDNGIGVASFDHDAAPDTPIVDAGPDLVGAGRIAAQATIAGHTSTGGGTSIGDGITEGQNLLDDVSGYDQEAMLVFTDGHETSPSWIHNVTDLINERVYAVGLGDADTIQPTALTELTNGTGGYTLLTGDLADDPYLLSKYFLQILAGVTNSDVVLDPTGYVAPGQLHRIPFHLSDADITSDVILLTPFPQVLRFSLESPAGLILDPAAAVANASASFVVGNEISLYRLTLPTEVGGVPAGAGTWHVRLEIDKKRFRKYLGKLRDYGPLFEETAAHGVRYSLNVHAYSNLRMRASLTQSSFEPGGELYLRVLLTEGGVPIMRDADVTAELTMPDGAVHLLELDEVDQGAFETDILSSIHGVYRFLVKATGTTAAGSAYTREQVVTGAVYRRGDDPPPSFDPDDDPYPGLDPDLCRLLHCLLGGHAVSPELLKKLRALGYDLDAVRRCLEKECDRTID